MEFLSGGLNYVVPFLIVLTVLVFVHELGHYLIARRNGVRVEVFSIGFGPELFGWNDRAGTRWKFSAIPLGGYVKMFGDSDASSAGPVTTAMTEAERAVSFHYKRLPQRAAIVAAGPLANFLFAIVLLAGLFMTVGQPFTLPKVGQVVDDSAAAEAGFRPGDLIVSIEGRHVERFEEVVQAVRLNTGTPMRFVVEREGAEVPLTVAPRVIDQEDRFGNRHRVARLGITGIGGDFIRHDPVSAVWRAGKETWTIITNTLQHVWEMIIGLRTTEDLGGPLRIAQLSGQVAQDGLVPLVWLAIVLSINLGLINLFPIPVLDGGHLLFYAAEAVRGRPLGQRAQEYGFRIGLALVLSLMVFATWNDLVHLRIVEFIKGLVT